MNKEELLEEISRSLRKGEVSREEILSFLGLDSEVENKEQKEKKKIFSATKILYYLGGAVIFLGIIFFFAQFWYGMGSYLRILITLGLGLVFALSGTVLSKTKVGGGADTVFHFIGGMLIPAGALVTISELNIESYDFIYPTVFSAIALFYFILNLSLKRSILVFFTFLFGTVASYRLLSEVLWNHLDLTYRMEDNIYAYFSVAVGIFYLLMSFNFKEKWHRTLLSLLNFFGSAWFFGALFYLATDYIIWLLLYPLIVLGGMFLSTMLKSRGILVVSTISLLTYVSYVTAEYFADSVGWPIALIFLGFVFIGLGFVSVSINKKYLK